MGNLDYTVYVIKSMKKTKKNNKKVKTILQILTLPKGTKVYETSVEKIMEEIRYGRDKQQA